MGEGGGGPGRGENFGRFLQLPCTTGRIFGWWRGLFGLDPCRLCWGSFGGILGAFSEDPWAILRRCRGVLGLVFSSSWADALPSASVQKNIACQYCLHRPYVSRPESAALSTVELSSQPVVLKYLITRRRKMPTSRMISPTTVC